MTFKVIELHRDNYPVPVRTNQDIFDDYITLIDDVSIPPHDVSVLIARRNNVVRLDDYSMTTFNIKVSDTDDSNDMLLVIRGLATAKETGYEVDDRKELHDIIRSIVTEYLYVDLEDMGPAPVWISDEGMVVVVLRDIVRALPPLSYELFDNIPTVH